MQPEFKSFSKILHIGKLYMSITQKLHGSNAQTFIYKDSNDCLQIKAGSRNRWLSREDDNYGFAAFVDDNKEQLIECLGEGRHFGEWTGLGINSGEGLTEKTLVLFNWRRWVGKELPPRVTTVPLLYKGAISLDAINDVMVKLKEQGSMLVPGFMKPEGVVIELDGQFYKNVFDAEETKWKETTKRITSKATLPDVSYLLQPLRLEKLLSKDEMWVREYPKNLGAICSMYVKDLEEEGQFIYASAEEYSLEKKALGKEIYYFVKSIVGAL